MCGTLEDLSDTWLRFQFPEKQLWSVAEEEYLNEIFISLFESVSYE